LYDSKSPLSSGPNKNNTGGRLETSRYSHNKKAKLTNVAGRRCMCATAIFLDKALTLCALLMFQEG
jgi:hypothetical protein